MLLIALSIALTIACWGAFWAAAEFSYLAENIAYIHGGLIAACLSLFLVGLAVAILASTDTKGRLVAPTSLSQLLCWILLVPQAGFAIGGVVNYTATLETMVAVSATGGARVVPIKKGVALLNGEIGLETPGSLVDQHRASQIRVLKLRSGGGLIGSAMELGTFVKENAITTRVETYCESACVIIALSGAELYVTPTAQFGFHNGSAVASTDSQIGRFAARMATQTMIAELRTLGISEEILQKAEQTPAHQMYYVSGAELQRLGLARYAKR